MKHNVPHLSHAIYEYRLTLLLAGKLPQQAGEVSPQRAGH